MMRAQSDANGINANRVWSVVRDVGSVWKEMMLIASVVAMVVTPADVVAMIVAMPPIFLGACTAYGYARWRILEGDQS